MKCHRKVIFLKHQLLGVTTWETCCEGFESKSISHWYFIIPLFIPQGFLHQLVLFEKKKHEPLSHLNIDRWSYQLPFLLEEILWSLEAANDLYLLPPGKFSYFCGNWSSCFSKCRSSQNKHIFHWTMIFGCIYIYIYTSLEVFTCTLKGNKKCNFSLGNLSSMAECQAHEFWKRSQLQPSTWTCYLLGWSPLFPGWDFDVCHFFWGNHSQEWLVLL